MEITTIQEENNKLKQSLQDIIDYFHYIGNDDCPITNTEAMSHIYKLAEKGLKN